MRRYTGALMGLFISMVMSGCLEIQVRTTVSADGSSEREISMKTLTEKIPAEAFPAGWDSTWTIEWRETGEKDTKYEYVARKKFPTAADLHREYSSRPDSDAVAINVSIDKKFEWFYSYVDYKEVYTRHQPAPPVPVTEYLTKEEVRRYVHGEKNDTLKDKVKKWDSRNMFEKLYALLVAEAKRRNDPALPASLLEEKKMMLFDRLASFDSLSEKNGKKDTDSTKKNKKTDEMKEVLHIFVEVLSTKVIVSYRSFMEQSFATVIEDKGTKKAPEGWTSSVQMPGMLLETNSDVVEGNTITWKFSADQIHVGDFDMHARSRVANVWAFVVTGIAALFVILLAIIRALRRRHK